MTKFRIMTFNIRGCFAEMDGENVWQNRADLNVQTINRQAPDLIGFQEVQAGNLATYDQHLTAYEHELGPRTIIEDSDEWTMYNPIFWRRNRFNQVDSGGFYLTRTPDRWSADWNSTFVRGATWVRLEDTQTGEQFIHINTHLDHIAELARVEGSKVIVQQAQDIGDHWPMIVTGDFNSRAWAPPDEDPAAYPPPVESENLPPAGTAHGVYLKAGFRDAYLETGNQESLGTNTFHAFHGPDFPPVALRIDWVLIRNGSQQIRAESCRTIRDAQPPLYPSDHYPVVAELVIE